MSSRKIVRKVRRPEKLVEIVEMKPKKRAQRQPKKQGRQRKQGNRRMRAPQNRRGIQRQPALDFFPRGNRQGSGFGRRKSIVIKESEFISEYVVANQPNFNVALALPINPGQAGTFPWLSLIAKQYEKYCFRSLRFIYKPEVTQFNPTSSAQGKVMMNCDYDSADAPPTTKKQVEDCDPHVDGMPYELISFYLDPSEMHKNSDAKYIRAGNLPGQTDIKTYDAGLLFVSNQGQTGNGVNLGELHVEYEVELSVPILEPVNSLPANNSVSVFQSAGLGDQAATGVETQSTLGLAGLPNGLNATNTAGSIVLPPGNYLLDVNWQFYVNATALDQVIGDIYKNGSSIFKTNLEPNAGNFSGVVGSQFYHLSASEFITSNGTDAYTFLFEAVYSSGTFLADIRVRFVAI